MGILPDDHVFYLIAWELASIASDRHQRLYSEFYEPQFRALYEAHGMDYDDIDAEWEDALEELDRLNAALGADEDRLREDVFREFGENEMADLSRDDQDTLTTGFVTGRKWCTPDFRTESKR